MARTLSEIIAMLPEERRARIEARTVAMIEEELALADRETRPADLDMAIARARAWTRKLRDRRPEMSVEDFIAEKRGEAGRE